MTQEKKCNSETEKETNERKIVIHTGKQGAINFLKIFLKECNLSKEEIETKVKLTESELEQGCYKIDKHGLELIIKK